MGDIRFDGQNALTIRRVGFVSVIRGENYTFEYKRGKDLFSFIFVESGALEYVFKTGERLRPRRGGVLYIPRKLPYKTVYLEHGTSIKILIFDTDAALLPPAFSSPIYREDSDSAALFRTCTGANIRNTLFLCARIYELLAIFRSDAAGVPKKHQRILPAIGEIKQKYYENRPVSYYAALCRMSESNFRLLFKQYTGRSPIEYRNRIRVAEARRMIDSGEFTAAEAAYLAGFNNMSFFYEQLKVY